MKGKIVTAAKPKATPNTLSGLLNKDNDNKEEKTTPETPGTDANNSTTSDHETVNENKENTEESKNDKNIEEETKPTEEGNKLSPHVVATVPNKTPAELSAETPEETAARYGVDQSINKEDADNPRVQVYKDTYVQQVPSGTHLHPDIAKDLQNRGISERTTDSAQVKRTVTETYDFADSSPVNDKF